MTDLEKEQKFKLSKADYKTNHAILVKEIFIAMHSAYTGNAEIFFKQAVKSADVYMEHFYSCSDSKY